MRMSDHLHPNIQDLPLASFLDRIQTGDAMAQKIKPEQRQLKLNPIKPFEPNPPKICKVYGLEHRMVRKFEPVIVDNPEYKGPPPAPIIVLACDCGHSEPIDL